MGVGRYEVGSWLLEGDMSKAAAARLAAIGALLRVSNPGFQPLLVKTPRLHDGCIVRPITNFAGKKNLEKAHSFVIGVATSAHRSQRRTRVGRSDSTKAAAAQSLRCQALSCPRVRHKDMRFQGFFGHSSLATTVDVAIPRTPGSPPRTIVAPNSRAGPAKSYNL